LLYLHSNADTIREELNISGWSNANDDDPNRVLSPLGIIIDSDSDDDTSVASTPVRSTTPRTPVPLRRSMSSSAVESLDRRRAREALFSPGTLDLRSPAFSTPGGDRMNDDGWSFPSVADYDDSSTIDFTFVPLPSAENQIMTPNNNTCETQLPPIHPSTPDNRSSRTSHSPNESGRLIQSLWSLSPIAKALKESTPRTLKRPCLPLRTDFSLAKRKPSYDTSDHSEEDTTGNVAESSSNGTGSVNSSIRYEFEAPRKGQLGLVIESNKKTGPIVHAVKDYSPLFGLVKKGDKIVEVDSRSTSHSTLTEITRLLAVRPGRRGSTLRIVISRSKEQNQAQDLHVLNHSRDNSYGSSSLESSRVLEDVDTIIAEHEQPSDDLFRNSYYSDHDQSNEREQGEL
jgi:hypothetical protein